jgi:hypothetical protein
MSIVYYPSFGGSVFILCQNSCLFFFLSLSSCMILSTRCCFCISFTRITLKCHAHEPRHPASNAFLRLRHVYKCLFLDVYGWIVSFKGSSSNISLCVDGCRPVSQRLFSSRHLKYASRACQHLLRSSRVGGFDMN